MIHFRRAVIAIGLFVAASATPLFRDILEIPKVFYSFAFERSSHVFLHVYGLVVQLFQCLSLQVGALLVFAVYCLNRLWKLLFLPLDYKRCLGDTGYVKQGISKRDVASEVRRRKKIGEIPPVYPNGWFLVLNSAELPVKQVEYVNILGEHLAVFRGEDGVVYILDAYCPHLGANIAVGGQVTGSCLQCPFHGWRFQGSTGACVQIPYSENVPEFAKTKSWHALEKNQRIYVWYHAEGVDPQWVPEDIEQIENGSWSFCGQTVHYINSHIQVGSKRSHTRFVMLTTCLQRVQGGFRL